MDTRAVDLTSLFVGRIMGVFQATSRNASIPILTVKFCYTLSLVNMCADGMSNSTQSINLWSIRWHNTLVQNERAIFPAIDLLILGYLP